MNSWSLGGRSAALAALIALLAMVLSLGCGGSSSSDGTGDRGTLDVYMVDAPPDHTITSVEVDISGIEAHIGSDWTVISDGPQTIDLLEIGMTPVKIAGESLPTGKYTQVRLHISEARVTDSTGTHVATVPSGTIRVNVNHTIQDDQITPLLLDFNVDRSLVKQGNGDYILNPVIPAVVLTEAGTVTGVATDGTQPLLNAKVWAVYTAGSNYALNTQVNVGSSTSDGTFRIWALLPGTYRLDLTWTDGATTRTATVNDVVVTANQDTNVGTVVLN